MLQEMSNNLSVVAAQLVEAACYAQNGDGEAAKAHIAHAMALLKGQPSSGPRALGDPRRRASQLPRGSLTTWQVRRVIAHIDANLAAKIRIEDLATHLNLSVGHFCRLFKSTFSTSAHNYLRRRRIEVAQALMLTTSDSLSQIALSCGMTDQSHFTRWFRLVVGETPYIWRRTRREAIQDSELTRALTSSRASDPSEAPSGSCAP